VVLTCKSFIKYGYSGERLIELLVAGSARSIPQDSRNLIKNQFDLVKRMIRGLGENFSLTYSQTLNGSEDYVINLNLNIIIEWKVLSGPFLVSRTGDAGCSERGAKASE